MGRSSIPGTAWALFAAALAVRVAWLLAGGIHRGQDTATYLGWAQDLADHGLQSGVFTRGLLLYLASTAILASLIVIAGPNAVTAWVLLQVIVAALAAIPLYLTARRLFGPRAALAAGIAYTVLFDLFQWDSYALTDSLFTSVVILVLYFAVRSTSEPGPRWMLAASACAIIALLLRPTGVVVVGALALWSIVGAWRGPATRKAVTYAAPIALAVAIVAILLVPSFASYLHLASAEGARFYARGEIVVDDPALNLGPIEWERGGIVAFFLAHPERVVSLSLLKIGALWLPVLPRYSLAHDAINLATLAPVLILGFYGVLTHLRQPSASRGATLLAALVVAFTLFHAFTIIDYDFRYRAPALPALCILAGGALERVWAKRA